jgi:hypothetical protein
MLITIMNLQYNLWNKVLLMPLMIIIIMLITYNTNLSYSQSNGDSLIFEDPVSGVQFQYTDEWIRQGSFLYGADSECTSLPCVRLPEVSVSTSPIAFEGFLLANYTKQQSLYHEDSAGYQPLTLNETKIGSSERDAFQYIYSTTSPFLSVNDEIINHEIYTTEGIYLYKISFTALQDEQFDKYLNSFKKIIDTFKIIR